MPAKPRWWIYRTSETRLTAANANPYRYISQYRHTTTDLYKMGVRYYQPDHGLRPTRRGAAPPRLPFGSTYASVGGNPKNFIDPTVAVSRWTLRLDVLTGGFATRHWHRNLGNCCRLGVDWNGRCLLGRGSMQHRYADLRLTTMTKPEKLAAFAIGMYAVVHNVLDPPGSTSQFVFRGLLLLALVLVLGTVVVRNRK